MQTKTLCAEVTFVFVILSMTMYPTLALSSTPITVALSNQNPYPVQPGQNVDVTIGVQNPLYERSGKVVVEFVPNDPFTLLPGQESRTEFTSIEALGSRSLTYRMATAMDAVTNSYDLQFKIYTNDVNDFAIQKVQINVQGQADFVIESLETEPETIEPGSQVALKANIKNVGTGTAHDLTMELNSANSEIVPLLSGGSVYVGDLIPGQTKVAEMKVSIDSAAEEQTYTLTLSGNYDDESGTATTKNFSVGLPVKGIINIEIISQEANYARGVVKIEIANKGTADAKSLETKLAVDGETIGIDYVSQLKATKSTNLEFPLVMQGDGILTLSYTGPGIEKNTLEKNLKFNFEPQTSGDGTTTLIYIVIIAVVAYLVYRKFFKKKKHR